MALTERLAILIDADGAKAVGEFNKVGAAANKSLGSIEDRAGKIGLQMQRIGAGATVAGATLTVGLSKAAQKASDLEQSIGAVDSVFGAAGQRINQFGETSASSVGLATAAFGQLSAQIGALLQGFGFTQTEAAETSIKLVELGADLSAAFGGTTADAITAIGAALRGERDPIEKYGVAFNEAGIQAKIAALGLDTSTAAAEQSAKAQAALAIIMERTSNVSGQFGRESDTLAHKQQVAAASAENAAAALGQGFAPVLIKVSQATTLAANAFAGFDKATNGIASGLAAAGVVALDVIGPFTTLGGLFLQQKAARAQAAAAAATEALATSTAAAATAAETAAKAAAITVMQGFVAAEAETSASAFAAAGAIGAETTAVAALGPAAGTAAIETRALAVANGQLALSAGAASTANAATAASAATAAGAFSKLGAGIGVAAAAYAAYQNFVNGAKDPAVTVTAEEAQKFFAFTVDDIRKLKNELGDERSFQFFESLLSQSEPAAKRFIALLREAGFETERFEEILPDSSNIEDQARYYSALSAFYRENADEAENLTASTAGLKSMLDSIGSKFESKFAALDAAAAFTSVYEAQKKATGSSRDYRAEQHSLEQATKSVTKAQEDLADAELAVFLARLGPSTRDKTNAELDRAEAALSLRDAENEVADAQRALNDARKEGEPEDVRDATRDLERANLNLRRSQLGNEDAQKAYNDTLNSGAESSDKVKDANEKLTEAQERLSEAQFAAEETQRRITEGTGAAAGAVEDYGAKAGTAAQQQWDYVQSLIDAGAPQDEINEALRIATGRVGDLERDFGDLNPKLGIYLQLLKEIANFEDGNEVAFATSAGGKNIVIRKKDVPGYKAPYDLSAPAALSASGMSSGTTVQHTTNVVIDKAVVGTAVTEWSVDVGGAPMMIRPPG